jgi:hypothetical protein
MKKLVVAVATVLCAGAVLAGGVSANPDAGTVVAEGFACAVLDADGNTVITTNSKLIEFQNKAVLRCSAEVPAPDAVVVWNFANTGLLCGMLQFGATENWSDKIGLGGLSQLVCTQALPLADAAAGGGAGIG